MKFEQKSKREAGNNALIVRRNSSIQAIFAGEPVLDTSGRSFCINVIVNDSGAPTARLFEAPRYVYDQLAVLNADYPLERTICKIERIGGRYFVYPIPKGGVSDVAFQKLQAVTLVKINGENDVEIEPEIPIVSLETEKAEESETQFNINQLDEMTV